MISISYRYCWLLLVCLVFACVAPTPSVAQCMGAGSNPNNYKAFPMPANNPANVGFFTEAKLLESFFHLDNITLEVSEPMDNALSLPTKEVILGQVLHDKLIAVSKMRNEIDFYTVGFYFIMAHEYAHQFQMKYLDLTLDSYAKASRPIEVQADWMAAYYAGTRVAKQADALPENARKAFIGRAKEAVTEVAFSLGTLWNTPQTHGSRAQRSFCSERAFNQGLAHKYGEDGVTFEKDNDGYKSMIENVTFTLAE